MEEIHEPIVKLMFVHLQFPLYVFVFCWTSVPSILCSLGQGHSMSSPPSSLFFFCSEGVILLLVE